MAQSRSGKAKKSTAKSSSAARSRTKKPATKSKTAPARATASRRAQRRQERLSVMWSIPLAGVGLLAIAMVLVPGQSVWSLLRGGLFGIFGVVTYFVGPLLLYMAYLVASGYYVGKFAGKTLLLALMTASVPVVFSPFTIGDSTFVQTVKMLYAWGQTRFWSGGVFGGAVGATLLALCGRPAANILMALLFVVGVMVFFAITPKDVVQFTAYQLQKAKDKRASAAEEATAYDTRLFAQEQEEEPLENLTQTLPQKPGRRAFDVAPYLAQEGKAGPAPTAAQPPVGVPFPAGRAEFDVDLGPDSAEIALNQALQNDPLKPVVIGPGGTFGLDPLEQLAHPTPPPTVAHRPEPEAAPRTGDSFEQRLDGQGDALADTAPADGEDPYNTALIRKAMGEAGHT
ncbi:MAG: hypothetical protein PHO10_11260, partial [Gemmiger sp.]|nr:hypothetical protein [Gemmiger sp.]